ncbi:MAG: 50S ribosomal protein L4 [Oscillospiraceae bacterium]|nr:50S ribosomal protein L4 [Oscillospiraceae bacterium]
MPEIDVFDRTGKAVGKITLMESIFGIQPNASVLHMAIVNFLANQRQGTQSTKTRGEVRGGGRKPWRQKGTGHARQGSIRAPHWRHGGVALGPTPRSYRFSLTKKVKRLAMKSAFSRKILDSELVVLDDLRLTAYRTKEVAVVLSALNAKKKVLLVLAETDRITAKSAGNITGVKVAYINTLNVYDIVNADKLVVLKDAICKIEEVYA